MKQQTIPSGVQSIAVRHMPSLPQISAALPLQRMSVASQTGVGHPIAKTARMMQQLSRRRISAPSDGDGGLRP